MTEDQPRRAPREEENPSAADAPTAAHESSTRAATAPDVTASPGGDYLSHRQILVVMGGLMAGMFLAALDQSIVAVALPSDHLRVGRTRQALLAGHRVHADRNCRHSALGQDLRPARSAANVPSRDCRLPDRLVDLRLRSGDRRCPRRLGNQRHDRRPSRSGSWRRRPHVTCARRHR